MDIQPPIVLDPQEYSVNLGGLGAAGCSPLLPFFFGGLAMFVLPPLLAGIAGGMRDEYRETMTSRRASRERARSRARGR